MATETKTPTHYTGGCHCKAFRYEIDSDKPFTELDISSCNCSICTSRGYLLTFFSKSELKSDNLDVLKSYKFNKGDYVHEFCPNCGSACFIDCASGPYQGYIALNVRTVDGLDVSSLKLKQLDGKSY